MSDHEEEEKKLPQSKRIFINHVDSFHGRNLVEVCHHILNLHVVYLDVYLDVSQCTSTLKPEFTQHWN